MIIPENFPIVYAAIKVSQERNETINQLTWLSGLSYEEVAGIIAELPYTLESVFNYYKQFGEFPNKLEEFNNA